GRAPPDDRGPDGRGPHPDVLLGLERDVAERLLRHVEHRQERGPRVRIERLEATDLGELRVGKRDGAGTHRSSSPPIMFTEPNVGMRSATIWPSIIRWSAAIGGKHGGRQRTR